MKQSNPINNFTEEIRALFQEAWKCWYCESNQADSLHHIVGRGEKEGDCESSPLNACPICNHKCHLKNHGYLMTAKMQKKLLNRTYTYSLSHGYQLKEKDFEFLQKYANLY